MSSKDKPYLTPQEVARWLMVSPITVRGWVRQGVLEAEQTPGGHRRFLRHNIERFARERGIVAAGSTNRVLVVEDDRPLSGLLVELISGLNPAPQVAVAYDGFEAGRQVASFEPDVVLLDLMIPGLDGFEVCRRLKSDPTTRGVRVIAITGRLVPEVERRILEAGAECVLGKPFEADRLIELLDTRVAAQG